MCTLIKKIEEKSRNQEVNWDKVPANQARFLRVLGYVMVRIMNVSYRI
jgi:hypothetical protein